METIPLARGRIYIRETPQFQSNAQQFLQLYAGDYSN